MQVRPEREGATRLPVSDDLHLEPAASGDGIATVEGPDEADAPLAVRRP